MCHDNTEVMFNKHVTFVAGQNGSGKSALLQGLQVCLGASARDTGRGSNLAGWVHKERRTATVTLEIWNSTEEEAGAQKWPPFKHELYGSLIRIVRKITAGDPDAAGNRTKYTATYQIFTADGREVKPAEMGHSAAAEVGQLAEHFNMDASNPLIVITQDMARQFHDVTGGSRRCKKYEMYMQGTCLAKTREELDKAEANVRRSVRHLEAHAERLRTKKEELRALEKKLEALQQADVYKQQLVSLELATAWFIVEEARAGLNAENRATAGHPARVAELETAVQEQEAAAGELQTQEAALRDEMEHTRSDELPGRMQQLSIRRTAARRRRMDAGQRLEAAAASQRDLADRRASLEEGLARLEAERRSEGLLRRVREHQEQVEAKQAELVALQSAATQLEADRGQLDKRAEAADAAVSEAAAAAAAALAAVQDARAAHNEVLAAAGAGGAGADAQRAVHVRAWGAAAMRLVDAVRAAPRGTFSQPPLGPMGLYLRRRADCDPGLGCLIELALGRCLGHWLVNNHADREALRRLATEWRLPRPTVLVSTFKERPLDYGEAPVLDSEGRVWRRLIDLVEPREDLPPLLRSSLINGLLMEASAANVVLVATQGEGQTVARRLNQVLVARRIRRAYDLEGFSYSALGGAGMTTESNCVPGSCRLAADNRAQLEESVRALAAREAELQQAEAAEAEAQVEAAAARRERRELQQRQMDLVRRQRLCQSQLDSLLERAPAAVSEAQSQELLNQLADTQRQLSAAAAAGTSAESERNNALAEEEAIAAEIEALRNQSQKYVARRQELVRQLNELAQRKQEAAQKLEARRQALQAARDDAQRAQERLDKFERSLEQAHDAATQICPREEGLEALEGLRVAKQQELAERYPNRTDQQRAELLAQIMTAKGLQHWTLVLTQRVASVEARAGGDLGSISVRLAAARHDLERDRGALNSVAKRVRAMQEACELRKAKYKQLRTSIDHQSNQKFYRLMLRRNIAAGLTLDHEAERLNISVRKIHERERATSLMQLSGGERSFTTSSFLLAMGEVVDAPFRAMDEYDIYMDPNARKLATMALLEYAWKSNQGSQLLLLSPQDTATLKESFEELQRSCEKDKQPAPPRDFVRIVQLQPPRVQRAVAGAG